MAGMSFSLVKLLAILLWVAVWTAPLAAEDWPQWRGPNRTGHVANQARVPVALPAHLREVWQIGIGPGLASPIIAGGKLFYFDNQAGRETIHALNPSDARELWRATVDDAFKDEQGPSGPRCTPMVDGDLLYAQSGKGELQCLGTGDGRLIWRINFMKDFGAAFLGEDSPVPGAAEHGYTASPVIVGSRLIACVGGTNDTGIVCFEKHSGELLWKSQRDRAAYAAPVVANLAGVDQVICFTVDGLIGLAQDNGALLWRVPLKTPYGRNCTTPVVRGDTVVVGSYRAGLVGIKVSAGGTGLKAERAWLNKTLPMNFSSPVCVGDYLFGLGPARKLICVEIETGRLAWEKPGYFSTPAELGYASFLVMGQNILVCADDGQASLIAADPAACRELGRARLCGPNWCSPAYADGRLYLQDGLKSAGKLYCYQLLP